MFFKKKKEKEIREKTWENRVRNKELSLLQGAREGVKMISRDISSMYSHFYKVMLDNPAPTDEVKAENEGAVALGYEFIWKWCATSDTISLLYMSSLFDSIYLVPGVLEDVAGEKGVTVKKLFNAMSKSTGKYEDIVLKHPNGDYGKEPYTEEFFDIVLDSVLSFKERFEPLSNVMRDEKTGRFTRGRAESNAIKIYEECLDLIYKKVGFDIVAYKKAYPNLITRKIHV